MGRPRTGLMPLTKALLSIFVLLALNSFFMTTEASCCGCCCSPCCNPPLVIKLPRTCPCCCCCKPCCCCCRPCCCCCGGGGRRRKRQASAAVANLLSGETAAPFPRIKFHRALPSVLGAGGCGGAATCSCDQMLSPVRSAKALLGNGINSSDLKSLIKRANPYFNECRCEGDRALKMLGAFNPKFLSALKAKPAS